jgi:uncharacterized protein YjlB
MDKSQLVQHAYIVSHILADNGKFPNNPRLPLLIYKGALFLHPADEPKVIEGLFANNGWTNSWVNGIYDYDHYHSNTHEAIGIFCGKADVQFGGPEGMCIELQRGDVMIIPAGVAHKRLNKSDDFCCVAAYPGGASYDMNTGKDSERPAADDTIKNVPVPGKDPVYGDERGLKECWQPPVS